MKYKNENLTQRAYLNTITGIIDFSSKQIVGFILNPITVSILGPYVYGIWKIIMQLNNYMSISDVNVSQTLRVLISRERSISSNETLRKYFTAAIYANMFFIPVYIFIGIILIWISPYMTGAETMYFDIIRICMSFLIISFIVKQIFSLFEAILRGMNLAYKRIGIRAVITIVGGILTAYVLHQGYGMIGMAIIQIIIGLVTGSTIWWIVYKNVKWFGITKIEFLEIKKMIKKSGKFMIERFVRLINKSSDIILLGLFAGPIYVSMYSISKFSINASNGIINKILPSVTPGFGKLIGEKKYEHLLDIRSKMLFLISYFGLITGVVICLLNKSFIYMWVGEEFFIGNLETIFLVVIGIVYVLQEVDGSLINMSLNIKNKIILGICSAFTTIILASVLIPIIQIKGLLIALLISRIIVSIGYFYILKSIFKIKKTINQSLFSSYQIIYLLILVTVGLIGNSLNISNWFILLFSIFVILFLTNFIFWFSVLNNIQRLLLKELLYKINFFNK